MAMIRRLAKLGLSAPLVVAGAFIMWLWFKSNAQGPAPDRLGWDAFGAGASLLGAGLCIPWIDYRLLPVVVIAAPFVFFVWMVLMGYLLFFACVAYHFIAGSVL